MSVQDGGSDLGRENGGSEAPAPEQPPEWLGPIYDRMDQIQQQGATIAAALEDQYGYGDEDYGADEAYEGEFDDLLSYEDFEGEHGDEMDEIAEQTATGEFDVMDVVNRSIDHRMAEIDAEQGIEARDDAFDKLRQRFSVLQNENTAGEILSKAVQLANHLAPGENGEPSPFIFTPSFVRLIELYAIRSNYETAVAAQRNGQSQQRDVQLEPAAGASATERRPQPIDWAERVAKAAQAMNRSI